MLSEASQGYKLITLVLIVLLIIWLIILAPGSYFLNSEPENRLISPGINESLAAILHTTYSTQTISAVQKYPLYFSLEEERLKQLYDTIKGEKKVKIFLNYGKRTIFTPMNFSYCHAKECDVINEMERWREADGLILTEDKLPNGKRPPGQLWFGLIHEPPPHISMANS
uniref:Uncharacterized protein n=1 Tax=Trichobilharzia regenti TaxID=157069 RepID=A0AA85JYS7_TRIRE|nr:unnamed protein product [Trichobilharzia regenti]